MHFYCRRLELDEPQPLEVVPALVQDGGGPPAKKMTPRRKELATKVKKKVATKAGK
jgi:hypothetical protein